MSLCRAAFTVLGAFALLTAAAACSRSPESERREPAPPVPVAVATAIQTAVPVQLRAIGNVQASDTVTVRSRVGGILAEVRFEEGHDVKEGQILFTLDRRALEADVRQAEANLAKSTAQLENA